eukprot:TRINITY_DN18426_c0_g1_i4.p1 TRINITY_DN18426_c0_g1~~TRINITY_DN18426_c0_g1_i4.p1  ORF type:complete len:354 (+),score=36.27 TRINITY_DN18426_c0_g1_i4:672-1733(+)
MAIVMEHAAGGSLLDVIKLHCAKLERIPEPGVWKWAIQACAGLNFLHCSGLLHRDIKPSNILLDVHRNAKLCDLGIAINKECRASGHGAGTLGYVSAEAQGRTGVFSERSDVFALGVTIFEMMALNQHPFDAASPQEIQKNIQNGYFPPVSSSKFSEELKDLSYKCMDKDLSRRPTTVDIFQMDVVLEAASTHSIPIPQVPASSHERVQLYNALWEVPCDPDSRRDAPALLPSKPIWRHDRVRTGAGPVTVDDLLQTATNADQSGPHPQRLNAASSTNRASNSSAFELPPAPVAAGFRAARVIRSKTTGNPRAAAAALSTRKSLKTCRAKPNPRPVKKAGGTNAPFYFGNLDL